MFHWERRKIRDGSPELRALGKEAREYIKKYYEPKVSYCIPSYSVSGPPKPSKPEIRYSLKNPDDFDYGGPELQYSKRPQPAPSADELIKEARHDPALFDSIAMTNTYHEWEKKNSVRKSFSSEVIRRLDESGTSYVDFYKRAWLDKKMFYKIKSDYGYKPSKETAVKCCFGLGLNTKDTEELLQLAEYSFSPSNSRDLAIKFCFEHGITNLREVNYLLSGLGERVME